MTELPLPDFYDDIALSFAEAQRLVQSGASDRRVAAHHPVVATVDAEGVPQQRVMILRDVDWASRELRFHTDSRSAKVEHVQNPNISVLIYDEPAKVQLRLTGSSALAYHNISEAAWANSTPFARRCYMAHTAPGSYCDYPTSGLPDWIEGRQPTELQLVDARINFAAVVVTVETVEWLYLANAGHRRARWSWDHTHAEWSGRWLVP